MNEMVERVARALSDHFHAQAAEYAEWILEHSDDGLAFAFEGSLDMRELALIAIRTMREPTEAMLNAVSWTEGIGDHGGTEREPFSEEYAAAFDAALKE